MEYPSDMELAREEIMDLHRAVDMLKEPYRSTIRKKYFMGMKISEIAREEGKPEGTVKSDLHKAKKELRKILGKEYFHV